MAAGDWARRRWRRMATRWRLATRPTKTSPKQPVLPFATSILTLFSLEASMSKLRPAVVPLTLVVASAALLVAQDNPTFDVVSIKRSTSDGRGGGGRTLPDGSQRMTNMPIRNFILAASPVPVREVVGLPDWALTERYDVELKPPRGSSAAQRRQMMQAMFAERMQLVAHVEQRERDVFSLVVARTDGKLGPELKPSPNDCSPPARGTPPATRPTSLPTDKEILSRCGEVLNETGLDGFYSITLKFSPGHGPATALDPGATPTATLTTNDDVPDIFTALEEQLGLKLVHGKKMLPVFVVDHIERPTEN